VPFTDLQNFSTATRQGVFQNFFAWMFWLPLAFFMPPTVFWVHKQVNTLYQFWIHTQLVGNLGWFLESWLNTPSHHRVHHARNSKYLDKNYAGVLIIWDHMFGTFEPESEVVTYGLVHPDTFYNVFKAQLGHYIHIFTSYALYDSVVDKLSVIFCGPGWMPGTGRLGDPVPEELCPRVPDGSPSPQPTYSPKIPEELSTYLILHVVVLFALIIIVNPAIENRSNLDWSLVVYSVLGIYQLSSIFQSGFAAFLPLEAARVLFYVIMEVACHIHDLLNNRTHGLWWSASYSNLSRFSYFDHTVLFLSFAAHFVSVGFILYHWDQIWTECSHTEGPPPNISIMRLVMPLASKLSSPSSSSFSSSIGIENTKNGIKGEQDKAKKKSQPPTPRSPKGSSLNKNTLSEATRGGNSQKNSPRNKNNDKKAIGDHTTENASATTSATVPTTMVTTMADIKALHHQLHVVHPPHLEITARDKLSSTHSPKSPKGAKARKATAARG